MQLEIVIQHYIIIRAIVSFVVMEGVFVYRRCGTQRMRAAVRNLFQQLTIL